MPGKEVVLTKYSQWTLLLAVLTIAVIQVLHAEEKCTPWQLTDEKRTHLTIGDIRVRAADVFDPSIPHESTALHRLANRLHINTRESIIRQQLLFTTGDAFDLPTIRETERLLQANRYIKEASVRPVDICGQQVTIEVNTQDVWTLTPGVSFGRSGGKNDSGVEIQEHNLLGLGKSLSLSYKSGVERSSTLLSYEDPLLLGSRKRLAVTLQNNSDGKGYEFDLGLPFFEFDSRRSWGLGASSLKQDNSVYAQGVVVDKVVQEKDTYSLFYGWSRGKIDDHVSRFKAGWLYSDDRYQTATGGALPSVTESYPWLEYSYYQDKYIKKSNFMTMDLLENVALGTNFTAGVGVLQQQFGSDENQLKLSTRFFKGYKLGEKALGFVEFNAGAYLGNGLKQGELVSLKGDWYSFNDKGNDYYLSAQVSQQSNLLPGEQITLGGNNGLRGYPTGYQTGDRRALVTAERRFHFNWYPFHIAKFGAVVFADAGTAWGDGKDPKVLADVGLGLRIVPTRSSSVKTLHIDLALPLAERNAVDSYQFLIKTKNSF